MIFWKMHDISSSNYNNCQYYNNNVKDPNDGGMKHLQKVTPTIDIYPLEIRIVMVV